MEVDDYVEHDQYWEEQCARQDMRIEELEKQHAQMLEALETADALIHRLLMGADYAQKEVEEIRAAIRAAKGEA